MLFLQFLLDKLSLFSPAQTGEAMWWHQTCAVFRTIWNTVTKDVASVLTTCDEGSSLTSLTEACLYWKWESNLKAHTEENSSWSIIMWKGNMIHVHSTPRLATCLTTPAAGKDVKQQNIHTLLVRATLKDCFPNFGQGKVVQACHPSTCWEGRDRRIRSSRSPLHTQSWRPGWGTWQPLKN